MQKLIADIRNLLFIVLFLFLLSGCATTQMTPFCDPDFKGKQFSKIMVACYSDDLGFREEAENAFVKKFLITSTEAVPSIQIDMPTRTYSDEEAAKIIKDNGIDGILIIGLTSAFTSQTFVPPTYKTTANTTIQPSSVTIGRNPQVLSVTARTTSTTKQYGGYYISKPRMVFDIELYDWTSKRMAWKSRALTRGNAYANMSIMLDSLATTAIQQLSSSGLVIITKPLQNQSNQDQY